MKKAFAFVALASSLPLAVAAPNFTGFISSATPTQEKTNPTITTGKVPGCVTTFRFVKTPITAQKLEYKIRCFNITAVQAAHIHGPADADNNAVVLVGLFSGPTTGDVDGLLTTGSIVRSTFPAGTAAFDTLISQMSTDQTYVNVHTVENAGGEVRGQIVPFELPNNPALPF